MIRSNYDVRVSIYMLLAIRELIIAHLKNVIVLLDSCSVCVSGR